MKKIDKDIYYRIRGEYPPWYDGLPDCECEELGALVAKLIYADEKDKNLTPRECRLAEKYHKKYLENKSRS